MMVQSEVLKACPPSDCTYVRRESGKAYPRTCVLCGLGPCPYFDKQGNTRPLAVATDEGVVERVSRAILDTAQRFDWTNIGPFEAEEFARAAISAMAHQP